jgi:hypothetical protein
MTNNILAIIIIVVTFWAMMGQRSLNQLIGAIVVIGGITLFVAFAAANMGDMGPAMGVGAFIVTLLGFLAYGAWKKKG